MLGISSDKDMKKIYDCDCACFMEFISISTNLNYDSKDINGISYYSSCIGLCRYTSFAIFTPIYPIITNISFKHLDGLDKFCDPGETIRKKYRLTNDAKAICELVLNNNVEENSFNSQFNRYILEYLGMRFHKDIKNNKCKDLIFYTEQMPFRKMHRVSTRLNYFSFVI
jgi:hypothetical protein